jgi:tRNA-splicing ligase RtcB
MAGSEYTLGLGILDGDDLAGDYASACHDDIHRRLVKGSRRKSKARIENHHNLPGKKFITEKK